MIGGSAAGSFGALLLARSGHEIIVFEREQLPAARDVESAAACAFRSSAPQIVQPHIVMARCRQLLIERLPDVYRAWLAAGVAEAPLATQMPRSLVDKGERVGDEQFTMLMSRRSTLDWVLQRIVRAEPRISVRDGLQVTDLLAIPGHPPRVTGVRSIQGDFTADVVVDASGRRSVIDRWLRKIGAKPAANSQAECGIAYYSRHYRLRPGVELPGPPTTRTVSALDEFTVGIWGADNGTMQLVVAPLATDRRFRRVKHPEVFTAVLRTVSSFAAWLDALDPITEVFPMGGLNNTMRRLVVDGAPVVVGLHAIGDSVCTTNPTLGRGLSLALSNAADLVETISANPENLHMQALELDRLYEDHVAPYYEDQAVVDRHRLGALRHNIFDAPLPKPTCETPHRTDFFQLRRAAMLDPTAFRAFWKIMGMLSRPDEVYADPEVVACTQKVLEDDSPTPSMVQPSREQLLAALQLKV
jgi:2-polyprenyl-6-methoxyphenol hydroxylase-like FAD-dependent oxidoreductase